MATVVHNIKHGTEAWYKFRNEEGLGGSDVPTIMGLNPYQSGIRLFYEKLGEVHNRMDTNEFMFWGQMNEDTIADVWQYYDGTIEGTIANKESDNIIRRCSNVHGFSVNDKYPWLFGSYDKVINIKGGFRMDNEDPLENRIPIGRRAPLEIKTLDGYAANQWEDGMPIYYIPQVETYKIILEVDYAELAVLKSGNRFGVYPMEERPRMKEVILELTKEWWDKVTAARKIVEERNDAMKKGIGYLVEACSIELISLEPEPDTTSDYEQFQSERARRTVEQMDAPTELEDMLKSDKYYRKVLNITKDKMQLNKNKIIKTFNDENVEKFIASSGGYAQYIYPKNTEKKRLYNKINWDAPEEILVKQLESLDIESIINPIK
jgi:putative phage-type endonuclease